MSTSVPCDEKCQKRAPAGDPHGLIERDAYRRCRSWQCVTDLEAAGFVKMAKEALRGDNPDAVIERIDGQVHAFAVAQVRNVYACRRLRGGIDVDQ